MDIYTGHGGPIKIKLDIDEARELAEMLERVPDDKHRRAADMAMDIRACFGKAAVR